MTTNSYHNINSVEFSQSNMWYKSMVDVKVSVSLGILEGKRVKAKCELKQNGSEEFEIIDETEFSSKTRCDFIIPYANLSHGENVIKITTMDEIPPDSQDGICEYEHTIIVETRDSFSVKRDLAFSGEYLISGPGSITNDNKFTVETGAGSKSALIVPRKPIEMDGRSGIDSIIVNCDSDTSGTCTQDIPADFSSDLGDLYMQTTDINGIMQFQSIKKIVAVDTTGKI